MVGTKKSARRETLCTCALFLFIGKSLSRSSLCQATNPVATQVVLCVSHCPEEGMHPQLSGNNYDTMRLQPFLALTTMLFVVAPQYCVIPFSPIALLGRRHPYLGPDELSCILYLAQKRGGSAALFLFGVCGLRRRNFL